MIPAQAFMNQLSSGQLQVPPILVIYGEEPLFIRQGLDSFRQFAQQQGYLQRERFEVDANFDWQALEMETQAGSLFADQRMLELNMPKGTPGKAGTDFIQRWVNLAHTQPPEICLLILCEKLEAKQTKAKWFQAIESTGLAVQSKPIEVNALPSWCQQRAQFAGFSLDQEAAALLAERVEGNLLAADQEMEKLSLLFPQGAHLTGQDIVENVADQAHYQLFALSSAALKGETTYALQILNRLRQEGLEAPIILWLLAREIRTLVQLNEKQATMPLGQVFKSLRIWSSRQGEYHAALRRHSSQTWLKLLGLCAQIDFEIKGIQKGDEWLSLNQLVVKISN